jgi:hypothetical protein
MRPFTKVTQSSHPKTSMLMVELVCKNDAEEICEFLTFDDLGEDSLEALEEANALITPIMNYIRECKGSNWSIFKLMNRAYARKRMSIRNHSGGVSDNVGIEIVGDISELGC